ncbi:AICAR transformylase/IMP cyclohydrolase PurH [Thermanaerovibrio velox DSM 12556]|uniref:Bifunctional purine biosynthesis protein PurH n=1 Tax=Thermanaerovibrio velox DSM 12556 TaxID=926567 RepID=H0US75_9BACT|nr:bifunctional phosphoribosylaminoimidazolecarboxamide formyltransferase/IMP cyclohydrolase [Thermanaerovibrio velox]EHM10164.1 AICAR transformylase/IMP cyclohydrolase PurH [Thermanaerovibrio velox DSM 12556]
MTELSSERFALISVYDKTNIEHLARTLINSGYRLVSSSGTMRFLQGLGLDVLSVEDITRYPHMLGGRVKTIHPKIAGGILFRRDHPSDQDEVNLHGIPPIDVVVCNLYPFEETLKSGASLDELIEQIDIGGVTLLRAAAKNYKHVTVLCDPEDYIEAAEEIKEKGEVSLKSRERYAVKALCLTAQYDATISLALSQRLGLDSPMMTGISRLAVPLVKTRDLRYGENPYQRASLWLKATGEQPFQVTGGKELSYNNILDADAALRGISMLKGLCACVIIKHNNPCGAAIGKTLLQAFEGAVSCDPVSAFGGIVGFTEPVDKETAEALSNRFFEVVIAPGFDEEAANVLLERRKGLRLITVNLGWERWDSNPLLRDTSIGTLVQEDPIPTPPEKNAGTWYGVPRDDLWEDMAFAWRCAALAKSNAIAVVKDGRLIGIGAGFTNRVDAARFALTRSGNSSRGAVMASDAFFPFPDTVEVAHSHGIAAIIQPGGSVRDQEVISKALELGIPMFVGGHRTFRH